jgi:hypothetical protein
VTTGFLSGGVCYETVQNAVDAYFSGFPVVRSLNTNGDVITVSYVPVAGVWQEETDTYTATGKNPGTFTTYSAAVPPNFQSCSSPTDQFQNGVDYGYA